MSLRFFATCPRGLEEVLVDELTRLKAKDILQTDGGVSFTGTNELLYRVNLSSRIATRILVLIKEGFYKKEDDLYKAALFSDWDHWFTETNQLKSVPVLFTHP